MTTRSHYDVLGVPPWATPDEVQRAYRDRARLLHPDHLASRELSAVDRARAEVRIREVNEAWRVLRQPDVRASYDSQVGPLGGTHRACGVDNHDDEGWWPGPFVTERSGPPRRRDAVAPMPSGEPVRQRRWGWFVWATVGAVLVVIFVATAYLGDRLTKGSPATPTTVAGGSCVRISTGPSAVAVPCSGPNDGQLVGHVMDARDCPAGSTARRIEVGDPGLSCLEPAQ